MKQGNALANPVRMPSAVTKIDLSGVNFLLIDDNQFIRRLLSEVLQGFGAKDVREAASCADAFRKIEQRPPDLILCDWMMSPDDGMEFLKQLRTKNFARIPVIMVTGHATTDRLTEAMGAGADSYIVKPFKPATLMEHIIKVMAFTQVSYL